MSKPFVVLAILLWGVAVTIQAQMVKDAPAQLTVTAATTEQGVRFVALGEVVEMRLEIFSPAGEKLLETEFRRGNVLDWTVPDSLRQPLSINDSSLCVLTVKTIAGHLRQRHGSVSWQAGKAAVKPIEPQQLSATQTQAWELSRTAQALPPLSEDADSGSFKVLPLDAAPSVTVTAYDGQAGQVTATTGALTFRTGDLFSGKDVERVRITPEGNVGIGTDKPVATLDIAGTIRAERVLIVKPAKPGNNTMAATDNEQANAEISTPLATGSGTQGQIAKWIDNAGTLGDSVITESGGNVGIGTTTPGATLDVTNNTNHLKYSPAAGKLTLTGPASNLTVNPGLRLEFNSDPDAGLSYLAYSHDNVSQAYDAYWNGAAWVSSHLGANFAIYKNASQLSIGFNAGTPKGSTFPIFNTTTGVIFSNTGSMGVGGAPASAKLYVNGNVGIGTTTPVSKLDVVGNVNFTGFRTELTSNTPNVIGGDGANVVTAGAFGATISGGGAPFGPNYVTNYAGTVGGGSANTAGNYATVAGGSGNTASGNYSSVPGGVFNTAQGTYSFAAGLRAQALHHGSFVWADSTTGFGFFASTADNQFLINATGGVGIGTNAPAYRLDVVGRSRIRQNAGQTGSTNTAGLWFFQNTPATDRAFVGMESDNSVGFFGGNGGGWGMIMNTQTGDVGIGTAAPQYRLHVFGQDVRVESNGASVLPRFSLNFTGGGADQKRWQHYASTGALNFTALNDAENSETGWLQVLRGTGTSISRVIFPNGLVGIGTATPSFKLHVNGSVGGVGPYVDASDLRYKRDIHVIDGALSKVLSLRGVTFDWRREEFPALNFTAGRGVGFVAQEVERVVPEAVTRDAAGFRSVAYSHLTPVLVEAVKEQQAQITQQQQTITELRRQNSALDARLREQAARLDALERVAAKSALRSRRSRR
jgi:hypothetical protein